MLRETGRLVAIVGAFLGAFLVTWIAASTTTDDSFRSIDLVRSIRKVNHSAGIWLTARSTPMPPCPKPAATATPTTAASPKRPASRAGTSIYSWTDSDGIVHVVDTVDLVPKEFRSQAETMKALPPVGGFKGTFSKIGELTTGVAPTAMSAAPRGRAVVYSASWCEACKAAKAFLKKAGIDVEERDIEKDKRALAELVALAGEDAAIPVTVIGDTVVGGFDEPALRAAIAQTQHR